MKKVILATIVALATLLTPVTVKANEAIHKPHAYTAIPVKVAKAKGYDTHTIETHWWVFSNGEIHEFLTFEEKGTVELGNSYPTIICDCMWNEEESEMETDYYCPFAFIPNLDEPQELHNGLNKKETRVLWFELGKEFFQIDKNLNRIHEGKE